MIVEEIMNTNVKTISPEDSSQEAAKMMKDSNVSCLIVVKTGKLVGILTEMDIIRNVTAENRRAAEVPVEEIMTTDVIMIKPDLDVIDAASVMIEKRIKKLPVVDNGKLLGIVTSMDIVHAEPEMIKHLAELFLVTKKNKPMAG